MAEGKPEWGGRDLNCALDVNRMAEMGKFPVDFHVYGCAYVENGEIYYRVSDNKEKLYEYIQNCVYENIYPTPAKHFAYSTCILSDQYETVMEATKYRLAQQLQQQYKSLFEELQPLADLKPNNAGYKFLQEMADFIEGDFEDSGLQQLEGAMEFALRAKILTETGYRQLTEWTQNVRCQMMEEPVVQDTFSRTFYGFGYGGTDGKMQYYYNAQKSAVCDRMQKLRIEGKMVLPIYKHKYWFHSFNQLHDIKKMFSSELQQVQDQNYVSFLKQLKALPGVVPLERLQIALEKLEQQGRGEAVAVLKYYGSQWNFC